VVCTNAWAGTLVPWCADKVDATRGQMLATAPAPLGVFPIPIYADHGYDYWRQLVDGRIVLGGWRNLDPSSEVGDADVLHASIQDKMTAFLHSFPELENVAIEHRWSGTMGFARDGLPMVGAAPGAPGAVLGVGFTGHGFGFAWRAGEALAQLVLEGRDPLVDLLTPSRLR
jgi:glycine/D-amino acid oxidase-like deaminating enzyme